jgi:hypothetical protein
MADRTRSTRFRPSPDTVAQRLGDEMVLIHMQTDRMFILNGTGTRVWELLSNGHDVAEIQRQVLGEFVVGPVELAAEIQDLLDSLRSEQLIRPDD